MRHCHIVTVSGDRFLAFLISMITAQCNYAAVSVLLLFKIPEDTLLDSIRKANEGESA